MAKFKKLPNGLSHPLIGYKGRQWGRWMKPYVPHGGDKKDLEVEFTKALKPAAPKTVQTVELEQPETPKAPEQPKPAPQAQAPQPAQPKQPAQPPARELPKKDQVKVQDRNLGLSTGTATRKPKPPVLKPRGPAAPPPETEPEEPQRAPAKITEPPPTESRVEQEGLQPESELERPQHEESAEELYQKEEFEEPREELEEKPAEPKAEREAAPAEARADDRQEQGAPGEVPSGRSEEAQPSVGKAGKQAPAEGKKETRGASPVEQPAETRAQKTAPAISTPAFKEWFGPWDTEPEKASKVVDPETKQPLRVYHGTSNGEINEFDPNRIGSNKDSGFLGAGFYFTDRPVVAGGYAESGHAERPAVVPAYLSIKTPFQWGPKGQGVRGLVMRGEPLPGEIHDEVIAKTGFHFDPNAEIDFNDERRLSDAVRDVLVEKGYDGVIAHLGGKYHEYVAFSPNQIKSATGNKGTFSRESNDIRQASPVEQGKQQPPKVQVLGHEATFQRVAKNVLGAESKPEDFAALAGAGSGSTVSLRPGVRGGITVEVQSPQYKASRYIYRDNDGKLVVENRTIDVPPEQQGSGIGTEAFARQVEAAQKLGVNYIQANASGEPGSGTNGYYTLPRLGFDQDLASLPEEWPHREELQRLFPEAKTVLDLMATPEGREWWKKNGAGLPKARFDLSPGSRSLATFNSYLKGRKKSGAEQPQPQEQAQTAFAPVPGTTIQQRLDNFTDGDKVLGAIASLDKEGIAKEYEKLEQQLLSLEARAKRMGGMWGEPTSDEHAKILEELSKVRQQTYKFKQDKIKSLAYQGRLELVKLLKPRNRISLKIKNTLGEDFKPITEKLAEAIEFVTSLYHKQEADPEIAPFSVKVLFEQNDKAFWDPDERVLAVALNTDTAAIVHELGHVIEDSVPGVKQVMREALFHWVQGERPQDFAKLFPEYGFKEGVFCYKDKFDDYFGEVSSRYLGRVYRDGATELFSTFLESMYRDKQGGRDPLGFCAGLPKLAKLGIGVLTGAIRGRSGDNKAQPQEQQPTEQKEVLDAAVGAKKSPTVPVFWTNQSDTHYDGFFSWAGREYDFRARNPYSGTWHVDFTSKKKGGEPTHKQSELEQPKDAFKVFETVGFCVRKLIEDKQPSRIVFTADAKEPSRVKLYDRLAKLIADKADYNLSIDRPSNGVPLVTYALTRKKESDRGSSPVEPKQEIWRPKGTPLEEARRVIDLPISEKTPAEVYQALKQVDPHELEPTWVKQPGKRRSYGAIIFNEKGQVLLRKPRNGFGGRAWDFPCGTPEKGEHPVDTARREGLEECGHEALPVGLVPGGYLDLLPTGAHWSNRYFVLAQVGNHDPSKMDYETEEVKWAYPEQALELIRQTPTEQNRNEDEEALYAAIEQYRKLGGRTQGLPEPKPRTKQNRPPVTEQDFEGELHYAPKGGVVLFGRRFYGGEPIPNSVWKTLDREQQAEIDRFWTFGRTTWGRNPPNASLPDETRPELTTPESAAVLAYTTGAHEMLNTLLRTKEPLTMEFKRMFEALHGIFKKARVLARPVKVYRGMQIRDPGDLEELVQQCEMAKAAGATIRWPGFTSTSTSKAVVRETFKGNVWIEINACHLVDTRPDGHFTTEMEGLLPHQAQATIERIERTNDGVVIHMNQVPPPEGEALPPLPKKSVVVRLKDWFWSMLDVAPSSPIHAPKEQTPEEVANKLAEISKGDLKTAIKEVRHPAAKNLAPHVKKFFDKAIGVLRDKLIEQEGRKIAEKGLIALSGDLVEAVKQIELALISETDSSYRQMLKAALRAYDEMDRVQVQEYNKHIEWEAENIWSHLQTYKKGWDITESVAAADVGELNPAWDWMVPGQTATSLEAVRQIHKNSKVLAKSLARSRDDAHMILFDRLDRTLPTKFVFKGAKIPEPYSKGSQIAEEFLSRVGATGNIKPPVVVIDETRARYDNVRNVIHLQIGQTDPEKIAAQLIHEYGHHLGDRDGRVDTAALSFLKYRLGDEPLVKLNVIPGLNGLDDKERGRKDRFDRAFGPIRCWYVGKTYGLIGRILGINEIISMGLQLMFEDPVRFAREDPEYFVFMIGVLDGTLRAKSNKLRKKWWQFWKKPEAKQ